MTNYGGPPGRPAVANAVAPTHSENALVQLSVDANGNLRTTSAGGGSSAVTIANGADVALGSTTDAANTTGTTGTLIGMARGIVQLLAACISIGSNWMQVSIQNATLAVTQSGAWIVSLYSTDSSSVTGVTAAITGTGSTSVIASAGGSLRNFVTSILVTNSHATVGTQVNILDGSTVIWTGYAAPAGGGFSCSFPKALRGTAATAINAQCVTNGSNVYVSASGYTGT